jgi:hypothetical protein
MRTAYKTLFRRAEGKISLGWPRHKREDNIKMDLSDTAWNRKMDSS